MSVGNEQDTVYVEPKKSGAGKWLLFGGCGCLFLILLVCGGGGYWFYGTFYKPLYDEMNGTVALLESSEVVQEKVGEPVTVVMSNQPRQESNEVLEVDYEVSGPNGNGTVVVRFRFDPTSFTWTRDDMYLEFEGEQINVDPDAETPELDLEGIPEL
jgi:hypothetical protein